LVEWNEAEREILKTQIKDKEMLDKNVMDRYVANNVAATLLLIDGMDTATIDQKEQVIKNMLKVIERSKGDQEPEKKIIL